MQRACRAIAISDAVNRYPANRSIWPKQIANGLLRHRLRSFEAVDASARQALHAQWGIKDGEMVIGTVARIVPQKAFTF